MRQTMTKGSHVHPTAARDTQVVEKCFMDTVKFVICPPPRYIKTELRLSYFIVPLGIMAPLPVTEWTRSDDRNHSRICRKASFRTIKFLGSAGLRMTFLRPNQFLELPFRKINLMCVVHPTHSGTGYTQ